MFIDLLLMIKFLLMLYWDSLSVCFWDGKLFIVSVMVSSCGGSLMGMMCLFCVFILG